MTPADQEFTHDPENGQHGDCQRAVLASLLDLPLQSVPHFLRDEKEGGVEFWQGIADFCWSHGYVFMITPAGSTIKWASNVVYHAISGPSPRGNGVYHTVIGRNGKIVFDPHPSRAGLAGDHDEWTYEFLVRLGNQPPSDLD